MNKKIFRGVSMLAGIVGAMSILGAGCNASSSPESITSTSFLTSTPVVVAVTTSSDEQSIRTLITTFGSKMKNVNRKAVKQADLKKQITDNYKGLISDALYSSWETDPSLAPGRPASSPWPDRIEIDSMAQTKPVVSEEYEIQANLVWLTSQGESSKEPLIIRVVKEHDQWVIEDYQVAPQIPSSTVIHTDAM